MSGNLLQKKSSQKDGASTYSGKQSFDFEAMQNIVGLFDLLLKIDRRVNPKLYEKEHQDD